MDQLIKVHRPTRSQVRSQEPAGVEAMVRFRPLPKNHRYHPPDVHLKVILVDFHLFGIRIDHSHRRLLRKVKFHWFHTVDWKRKRTNLLKVGIELRFARPEMMFFLMPRQKYASSMFMIICGVKFLGLVLISGLRVGSCGSRRKFILWRLFIEFIREINRKSSTWTKKGLERCWGDNWTKIRSVF